MEGLVLSNAVQNSMNGGDNTVLGGLISAATLIALHYVVAFATFKSKRLEAWIEGTPRIVVHNGVPNEAVMRSEFLAAPEQQRLAQGPGRAAPRWGGLDQGPGRATPIGLQNPGIPEFLPVVVDLARARSTPL